MVRCLRGAPRNLLLNLAAVALETFERDQCIFHEGRRQVVLGDLNERLENLEMIPPRCRPEYHMGLDRWAPRDAASELRYHHGFVAGERKARASIRGRARSLPGRSRFSWEGQA